MTEDYKFEANNPRFFYHMEDKERFQRRIDESTYYASGYLEGTEDFCKVIVERIRAGLSFEELKSELLGFVEYRREFENIANDMYP